MNKLTEPGPAPEPEPHHGFEDSRRLTGANRWFAGTAVILTPLGRAAADITAHARWASRVEQMATLLGWPAPAPRVQVHGSGCLLAFAAPADRLFTATEVNEWAWERCAAEAGETGFDIAHPWPDEAAAASVFAARAAAEQRPAVDALRLVAAARGLPVLQDDEMLSIGAGHASRCWPLDSLPAPEAVPWQDLGDVPTALVTGSNGKTTTVRLLAAMWAEAGQAAGCCNTEGVVVAGQPVERGDYSGPAGARVVLRHRGLQAAVLETARGGLLRRGLAVARADVAVVTNISPDHLGEYGVDSADDLAEVKLVVAHAVTHGGWLVLNADDDTLMAAAARLPQSRGRPGPGGTRWALFAHDDVHPELVACRAGGGSTCAVKQGRLHLHHAGRLHDLGAVVDLPITLGGAARHNVENAAAAALAAAVMGVPVAAIQATLQRFGSRPGDNAGRLETWQHRGATVLVDYAHNPDGLAQLLRVARALGASKPGGRLGLLLGQAGNRDDAAISELARTAAAFEPDLVVLKELPDMLRGRALGEVPALIERVLVEAGLPAARVRRQSDEEAAARELLAWARPGDVAVLPVHKRAVRERLATFLASSP